MYTRHGHQITGTPVEGERPLAVARCGGPKLCRQCYADVARHTMQAEPSDFTVELGTNTMQAFERVIALGLEQRPLPQAQQARVLSITNLNTPAAIQKVSEVLDGSLSVLDRDNGSLLQELLNAGIEFYYNPNA